MHSQVIFEEFLAAWRLQQELTLIETAQSHWRRVRSVVRSALRDKGIEGVRALGTESRAPGRHREDEAYVDPVKQQEEEDNVDQESDTAVEMKEMHLLVWPMRHGCRRLLRCYACFRLDCSCSCNCRPTQQRHPLRYALQRVCEHAAFLRAVDAIIVVNVVTMCLPYDGMSNNFAQQLSMAEHVCTALYAVEMGLKLLGHGCASYWAARWNVFDGIIVIISLFEMWLRIFLKSLGTVCQTRPSHPCIGSRPLATWARHLVLPTLRCLRARRPRSSGPMLTGMLPRGLCCLSVWQCPSWCESVSEQVHLTYLRGPLRLLRILRILRMLRLARNWSALHRMMATFVRVLPDVLNIFFLMWLVLFVFALLGMQVPSVPQLLNPTQLAQSGSLTHRTRPSHSISPTAHSVVCSSWAARSTRRRATLASRARLRAVSLDCARSRATTSTR